MSEEKKVPNNSEILFLYDAKRTNPNGDMDNENKPRMDWDTGTNLVSDVRLKRYIRDYLLKVKNLPIFVRKLGEDALKAKEAIGLFKLLYIDNKDINEIVKKDLDIKDKDIKNIGDKIFEMADIRLFGATIPVEVESGKGSSSTFTGPVQFNWGYSLNKVELQESKTITSNLATSDSTKGAGIGKDYRVKYSFIAFSGGISALAAKDTKLSDDDIKLLDESIIKSIPLNRTRSKIGQTPRLYLRIEMKDQETVLNDLREYIDVNYKIREEDIREINDLQLNIDELLVYLLNQKNKIKMIHYWKDEKLIIKDNKFEKLLGMYPTKELNY
ncbi:type I-B CRISPR-associated protein Cas7/Csh2 [Natronospora cellulosivora (SeqCode)]